MKCLWVDGRLGTLLCISITLKTSLQLGCSLNCFAPDLRMKMWNQNAKELEFEFMLFFYIHKAITSMLGDVSFFVYGSKLWNNGLFY
jgi:hypothetical protein